MGVGSSISIYEDDLNSAVETGIISQEQAASLWPYLVNTYDTRWRLTWTRLAYAFGSFLIIGSLTWFSDLAWQDPTGFDLLTLSTIYVLAFAYAGKYFWNNTIPNVPQFLGGVFMMIAVSLSPVITFSVQKVLDYWLNEPYDYILQESTLVLAGFVGIYLVPFPYLTAPVCFGIYSIIGNNLTEIIFGPNPTVTEYSWVAIFAGAFVISGAYLTDKNWGSNFSFLPFILGVGVFWGGWTSLLVYPIYTSWWFKASYLAVNFALVGWGMFSQKLTFSLFGSLGTVVFTVDQLYVHASVADNAWVSIGFGTILVAASYYYGQKNPTSEFPFWGFLFGVSIFWGGWTTLYEWPVYTSEIFKFIYFLVNVGLMVATIPLKQRVFFYWGIIGTFIYVTDMVQEYWSNSWYLPVILTIIGLAFIALAVYFSNHPGFKAFVARKRAQFAARRNKQQNNGMTEIPLLANPNDIQMMYPSNDIQMMHPVNSNDLQMMYPGTPIIFVVPAEMDPKN